MNMQYILLAVSILVISFFTKEQIKGRDTDRNWIFIGMNMFVIVVSIIKLLKQ